MESLNKGISLEIFVKSIESYCSWSMECMDSSRGGVISDNVSVEYDCRRYPTVYGIEVTKFGRWIRIISVWNFQTAVFNCRASVSLECMRSPDGGCRSVSYGVMKIRKTVAIVWRWKMGGCEHHYLSMTWVAPITSKLGSNKAPKRGKWVVCFSRLHAIQHRRSISSWKDELDERGFTNWGWKTASRWWLKKACLACPVQFCF